MKLKKAVSLCVSEGNLSLFNRTDLDGVVTQWISDGRAVYPLGGIPFLDEETVCTVFDIPEKKQEKMMIRCQSWPESLRVDDYDSSDKVVEPMAMSINYGGYTVIPMVTRGGGIMYIQKKYLGPLEDAQDILTYCERVSTAGQKYIAVFNGLLLAAIIFPYDMINDDFMEKAETIRRLTEWELTRKRLLGINRGSSEGGDQDEDQGTLFEAPESAENGEDEDEDEYADGYNDEEGDE